MIDDGHILVRSVRKPQSITMAREEQRAYGRRQGRSRAAGTPQTASSSYAVSVASSPCPRKKTKRDNDTQLPSREDLLTGERDGSEQAKVLVSPLSYGRTERAQLCAHERPRSLGVCLRASSESCMASVSNATVLVRSFIHSVSLIQLVSLYLPLTVNGRSSNTHCHLDERRRKPAVSRTPPL